MNESFRPSYDANLVKMCKASPRDSTLARDAIASQTKWQHEDGVVVEACRICYEDVPVDEKFTVFGCYHRICFDCIKNDIMHSLRHRGRLICPNVGCKLYCLNPRCSILMSARGLPAVDSALLECLGCGLRFCVNCKMEWHTKLSCAAFRKTKAYTKSGTAVFDDAARELGLKKCSKHMPCTFCKYEFCYTCGNEWKNKKPTCKCAPKDIDLDFCFYVDPLVRKRIIRQTNLDCELLEEHDIMDYSLLVGLQAKDSSSQGSVNGVNPVYGSFTPPCKHKLHQTWTWTIMQTFEFCVL
ncbi:unnamed protein product [Eruca vesicaria subsp. sativa]|uniref:RBR-type E3 ubiquitin transferase n=1 Tax=Eruca vesicaria subsp. sativa TaxID=29727 RepID=A0ABC8JM26_ERUVS|nr:unnamed protein product [Eruca vesicaria subsp. sativa]